MTPAADVARPTEASPDRAVLRRQMRKLRRALPRTARLHAAHRVAIHLLRRGVLMPRVRLGAYLALPEELDLQPTLALAWQQQCQTYVPHITHSRRGLMAFVPIAACTPLKKHRWGQLQISKPPRAGRHADQLDVILVPLVAFDHFGHRLGMGGGFYDRFLERLARQRGCHQPRLIGIAFDEQQLDAVPKAAHDVVMDAIVTPSGYRRCSRSA